MQALKGGTNSTGIDEEVARHSAELYVAATFGPDYEVQSLERMPGCWWVRITCQHPTLNHPLVATMRVDLQTGNVIPLDSVEVQDIKERAQVMAARQRRELARSADGYILPYQAKIRVNGYLADYVAFFASAEGRPEWVDDDPPLWRFHSALWLRGHGKVCELGPVDVNALTGEVIPLTIDEISTRQKRARHAAKAVKHSTAARG
jgi:hypothetical protein